MPSEALHAIRVNLELALSRLYPSGDSDINRAMDLVGDALGLLRQLESQGEDTTPVPPNACSPPPCPECAKRAQAGTTERAMLALTDAILELGPDCPECIISARNALFDALHKAPAKEVPHAK